MRDTTQRPAQNGSSPLHVQRYHVRRWTAFEWSPPSEDADGWFRDKEGNLTRAAALVLRKLREMCPDWSPGVTVVRVNDRPELLFEIDVRATDEDDARRRGMYRFDRALSVRIPDAGAERVQVDGQHKIITSERTLSPPWGKCEVEVVGADA